MGPPQDRQAALNQDRVFDLISPEIATRVAKKGAQGLPYGGSNLAPHSHQRATFWYSLLGIYIFSTICNIVVILKNDLSASYFSYKDEYWTIYYEKPYSRVPAYLIGVIWGCSYFTYKHEQQMGAGVLIRR